jgi:cold shock CspA family protein
MQRLRGRIRRIKAEKKYGWIAGDDGIDYFFHAYGIKKSSPRQFNELHEQDRLEFDTVHPDGKGPRAIEIVYLDD